MVSKLSNLVMVSLFISTIYVEAKDLSTRPVESSGLPSAIGGSDQINTSPPLVRRILRFYMKESLFEPEDLFPFQGSLPSVALLVQDRIRYRKESENLSTVYGRLGSVQEKDKDKLRTLKDQERRLNDRLAEIGTTDSRLIDLVDYLLSSSETYNNSLKERTQLQRQAADLSVQIKWLERTIANRRERLLELSRDQDNLRRSLNFIAFKAMDWISAGPMNSIRLAEWENQGDLDFLKNLECSVSQNVYIYALVDSVPEANFSVTEPFGSEKIEAKNRPMIVACDDGSDQTIQSFAVVERRAGQVDKEAVWKVFLTRSQGRDLRSVVILGPDGAVAESVEWSMAPTGERQVRFLYRDHSGQIKVLDLHEKMGENKALILPPTGPLAETR